MKRLNEYEAFVYFMTNKNDTVLYVGVTNDLRRRDCTRVYNTV